MAIYGTFLLVIVEEHASEVDISSSEKQRYPSGSPKTREYHKCVRQRQMLVAAKWNTHLSLASVYRSIKSSAAGILH